MEAQASRADSTLTLYRTALAMRHQLPAGDGFTWLPSSSDQVLAFQRDAGWVSITNFGPEPVALPPAGLLLTSSPLVAAGLPTDTTAWLKRTHP